MSSLLLQIQLLGTDQEVLVNWEKKLKGLRLAKGNEQYLCKVSSDMGFDSKQILENSFKINENIAVTLIHLTQDMYPPSVLIPFISQTKRIDTRNSKIILVGGYLDYFTIRKLFLSINPDGFLIKMADDMNNLEFAIRSVIDGQTVYGNEILRMIRCETGRIEELDETNRNILYALQQGLKQNEIPLPISTNTVHKRMQKMSEFFDLKTARKSRLIKAAERESFI